MKSTYSKITILVGFIAVIATGIYLFRPKDAVVTETSQTVLAPQAQNQPVQSTIYNIRVNMC